ncbi:hypothetical protein MRBLWO14_000214 [Microbacterium sp. LWO14-1.2]|uniref:hypothetical protein n=1 Tax=Microbacterium sp. LWO14-1.2 TaxID=3135263 RepID=UPI00313916A6
MQTFYIRTRRIAAAFLGLVLGFHAVLGLARDFETRSLAAAAVAGCAIAVLAAVAVARRLRLRRDITAFFIAGVSAALSWNGEEGATAMLTYLPALIAAIAFATLAVILHAEKTGSQMRHRL